MAPGPVALPGNLDGILQGSDFADAFALDVEEPDLDAMVAARRAMENVPRWVTRLLRARDTIVRPFGVETVNEIAARPGPRCGFFPILQASPSRVVMGLDDRHLDFRIVVDTGTAAASGTRVTLTTLVKRHNALGRVYLATIMPFHKLIVPTLLARVA